MIIDSRAALPKYYQSSDTLTKPLSFFMVLSVQHVNFFSDGFESFCACLPLTRGVQGFDSWVGHSANEIV